MSPNWNNLIDNDEDYFVGIELEEESNINKLTNDAKSDLESGGLHEDTDVHTNRNDDNGSIRHRIMRLSSQIRDEKQLSVDDERLSRSVRDAGEYAFGIVAVEVWALEEDTGRLVRPNGGWWRSPHFRESEALRRLEDKSPESVMPGVDLAGVLWAESTSHPSSMPRHESFTGSKAPGESLVRTSSGIFSSTIFHRRNTEPTLGMSRTESFEGSLIHGDLSHGALVWRDLRSLVIDPDTPKSEKLILLEKAGFGKAAGVPFNANGHKGVVIYFSRSTTNEHQLRSPENEAYLLSLAELIGVTSSVTAVRRASVASKNKIREVACQKFKRNLRNSIRNNETDKVIDLKKYQKKRRTIFEEGQKLIVNKVTTWMKKCLGGNLSIPPGLSFRQSLCTMVGAFFGLLVLSTMNEYAMKLSDKEYFLLIGPFGALMTLQYGLCAAPASQPRNVIMGQAIAGAVSMSFTYIPDSILSPWVRRAVGPAVAIATMVKLGFTHPPAGAHSVIYASGDFGWMFYFLVVLASIISVVPATLINNMSEKRQYPTYWGHFITYIPKLHCVTKSYDDTKEVSKL